jgi:hypothetical protein
LEIVTVLTLLAESTRRVGTAWPADGDRGWPEGVNRSAVTLNQFRVQLSACEAARRWMLKQVQHDGQEIRT